jgi:hypothetical protein
MVATPPPADAASALRKRILVSAYYFKDQRKQSGVGRGSLRDELEVQLNKDFSEVYGEIVFSQSQIQIDDTTQTRASWKKQKDVLVIIWGDVREERGSEIVRSSIYLGDNGLIVPKFGVERFVEVPAYVNVDKRDFELYRIIIVYALMLEASKYEPEVASAIAGELIRMTDRPKKGGWRSTLMNGAVDCIERIQAVATKLRKGIRLGENGLQPPLPMRCG